MIVPFPGQPRISILQAMDRRAADADLLLLVIALDDREIDRLERSCAMRV